MMLVSCGTSGVSKTDSLPSSVVASVSENNSNTQPVSNSESISQVISTPSPYDLPNDVYESLLGDIELNGTIKYTNKSETVIYDTRFVFVEDAYYRSEFSRDLQRTIFSFKAINEDGWAMAEYLDISNKVVVDDIYDFWETYENPFSMLSTSSFELTTGSNYILNRGYVKNFGTMLLTYEDYSYTAVEFILGTTSHTLKVHATYPSGGVTYTVLVELEITTGNEIVIPEIMPYATLPGQEVLGNAFIELGQNFTMSYSDNATSGLKPYFDYYTEDMFYSSYVYSGEDGQYSKGAIVIDEVIYEFFVDENNYSTFGEVISEDISDMNNFSPFNRLSAQLFEVIDENTFRAYDEIANIICVGLVGFDMGASNLRIILEDGVIAKVTFDFNFDGFSLGSVEMLISEIGTTDLSFIM